MLPPGYPTYFNPNCSYYSTDVTESPWELIFMDLHEKLEKHNQKIVSPYHVPLLDYFQNSMAIKRNLNMGFWTYNYPLHYGCLLTSVKGVR